MAVELPLPAALAADMQLEWCLVPPPYGPVEQSRAGRRAAAGALAAAASSDLLVLRADDGRPIFPAGFTGSIAHTDRVAVAVVAPGCSAVGVDIENAPISPRVARFVLYESERHDLLGPDAGFTPRDLFAAKEAAFKALYGPDTKRDLLFWRVRLARIGGGVAAFYRGARVPVWVSSNQNFSLAVALRH